jgi:hypothetical protein
VVTTNATPCGTPGTSSSLVSSVITITGLGDHDQPDWLITMTGIRNFSPAIIELDACDAQSASGSGRS